MATKEIYFSNNGIPEEGLTLAWTSLKKVSDGSDFTPQPTFTEIGGGWYKFDINPTEKLTGVIDGSASLTNNAERYQPVYFDLYDYLFDIVMQPVYNEDADALTFLTWILKNGQLQKTGLTLCEIDIYDSAHTLIFSVSGALNTNGVFAIPKSSPGLVANTIYYADIYVTLDGIVYESLDSYISLE